jgi:phytoene synthase
MTVVSSNTTTLLESSRRYCERLTRQAAKNFYYGLKLLPEPKRSAMFALYAYMRLVDDIADDEDGRTAEQRVAELEAWKAQTHAALAGENVEGGHLLWPAFCEVVRTYNIPALVFDEVIEGQRQDLEPVAFETFEQLRVYCRRVAGVVGLASICVWGFEGGKATEAMAVDRGIAFQLTNILRDLREDAGKGRMYLPREELARFGVSVEDIGEGNGGEKFLEMMRFQIERAEGFYKSSRELEERIERSSRPTLVAMTEIYHSLLELIAADPGRVLKERVGLSAMSKLKIGWKALREVKGSRRTSNIEHRTSNAE